MPKLNLPLLHTTAFFFAEDPTLTVKALAKKSGASTAAIYEWAKRDEWHEALDKLGYEGERKFASKPTRDIIRDSGALVDLAEETYHRACASGMRKVAANKHTAKVVNVAVSTIEKWKRRFNWEGKQR